MSKYANIPRCNCSCSSNYNIVSGNYLDIEVNYCESEIRADVVVSEYNSVRLWGRVVNCDNKPIANALIKLLKVEYRGDYAHYMGIAHTVSDCDGFYQFELCHCNSKNEKSCFKILVSKAAYGPERIMPTEKESCNPCNTSNGCAPDSCREYPPIIQPKGDIRNNGYCCDENHNYNYPYHNQNPRY